MERIYIKDLKNKIGEEVKLAGWVDVRRDHGKLIFIDLRDMSGKAQMVALPNHKEAHDNASKLRSEWVVEIIGKVNKRPEKMINKNEELGEVEVEIIEVKILSEAEIPFEKEAVTNLDTHLDNLPLTLITEKSKAIFKVQAEIVKAFREFLNQENFTEFQAPKLIGEDAEGGANSFDVTYFKHIAHLAQSPQLYKQIMVGVFERVFAVGNVYRAEKHSTTRHLNEYTSLDFEIGFIKDHTDILVMENRLLSFIVNELSKRGADDFVKLKVNIPVVPAEIPKMKLREAQQVLEKEFGLSCVGEPDLEPQHERHLCEYAQKKWNSDFIFITHFPISKRPFYTYEDEADPGHAKGFDLLFRGVEITTGAQRIHNYKALVASLQKKKLDPEKFSFYLQAFKYG